MSKKKKAKKKGGAPTIFRVLSILLILCILGALIAFFYIYTNGFNEDLRTFYLEYRDEKLLTAKSKRSFYTEYDYTFHVRYTFDFLKAEKGYDVKIYSRDLGKNSFDYKIDGKTKRWVGGMDLTEGFEILKTADSFTVSFPKGTSLTTVLEKANDGRRIECPSLFEDFYFFTMVVENYNGTSQCEIEFEILTFSLDPKHVVF